MAMSRSRLMPGKMTMPGVMGLRDCGCRRGSAWRLFWPGPAMKPWVSVEFGKFQAGTMPVGTSHSLRGGSSALDSFGPSGEPAPDIRSRRTYRPAASGAVRSGRDRFRCSRRARYAREVFLTGDGVSPVCRRINPGRAIGRGGQPGKNPRDRAACSDPIFTQIKMASSLFGLGILIARAARRTPRCPEPWGDSPSVWLCEGPWPLAEPDSLSRGFPTDFPVVGCEPAFDREASSASPWLPYRFPCGRLP